MTNMIPLPLKGDLIEHLQVREKVLDVLWRDGDAYFALKPICSALELSYQPQHRKFQAPESDAMITLMVAVAADGKQREMLCVAYPDLLIWLGNIQPSRVKPHLRDKVSEYRRELRQVPSLYYHDRLLGQAQESLQYKAMLRHEYSTAKPTRAAIAMNANAGCSFEQIWRSTNWSKAKVTEELKKLLFLDVIQALPADTPNMNQLDLGFGAGKDS